MVRLVPTHPHFSIGNDDSGKARRLNLRDMPREAFPDGGIPDPYTTACIPMSFRGTAELWRKRIIGAVTSPGLFPIYNKLTIIKILKLLFEGPKCKNVI